MCLGVLSRLSGEWLKVFFTHFECVRGQNGSVSPETFASELRVEQACPTLMTSSLTVEIVQLLLRTSCTFSYTELPHFVVT